MMPRSLSQTGPEKRRFTWPKGTPQIIALLLVLLVDSLVAPHFYQVVLQDGRLFGSPIMKRHNMRMLRQPQRGLLFEDVFPVPVHHAGAKHMLAAAGGN